MPIEMLRAVETMTPYIRGKLIEWGILASTSAAGSKPLSEHLDEWKQILLDKGTKSNSVTDKIGRVRRTFDACGFKFWTDITAEKVQRHLSGQRSLKKRPMSAQTFNHYIQAVKQFYGWMVKSRRASQRVLFTLDAVNAKAAMVHDRRALDLEEARWLVHAAKETALVAGIPAQAWP